MDNKDWCIGLLIIGIIMFMVGATIQNYENNKQIKVLKNSIHTLKTDSLVKSLASAQIGYNCAKNGVSEDETISLIVSIIMDKDND